jgi:uncharacterized protein YodC (DUF2158 family)
MFPIGDTVCLKSGGPLMTVGGPSALEGEVECYWFDPNEVPPVPHNANFPLAALERAEESDSSTAAPKRDPDRA